MIVALGNEDKLYDARLAHILELFRQAHPETALWTTGTRQETKSED